METTQIVSIFYLWKMLVGNTLKGKIFFSKILFVTFGAQK